MKENNKFIGNKFVGKVVDYMNGDILHQTRPKVTWEQAHKAATNLAKRNKVYHGHRYGIVVM